MKQAVGSIAVTDVHLQYFLRVPEESIETALEHRRVGTLQIFTIS
jgi:hypothetical protein